MSDNIIKKYEKLRKELQSCEPKRAIEIKANLLHLKDEYLNALLSGTSKFAQKRKNEHLKNVTERT